MHDPRAGDAVAYGVHNPIAGTGAQFAVEIRALQRHIHETAPRVFRTPTPRDLDGEVGGPTSVVRRGRGEDDDQATPVVGSPERSVEDRGVVPRFERLPVG
jgi:hypothetical protein